MVSRRAEDRLRSRRRLRHERRRQWAAKTGERWRPSHHFGRRTGGRSPSCAARPFLASTSSIYVVDAEGGAARNLTAHSCQRERSRLVARRADDSLRARLRHLAHERRRERQAQADERCGARPRSQLVARRAKDRLRSPYRKGALQAHGSELRGLRHERRRQRTATAGGKRRATSLVVGREEDRRFETGWQWRWGANDHSRQLGSLRHERRRERAAQRDPEPALGRLLSRLVARAEVAPSSACPPLARARPIRMAVAPRLPGRSRGTCPVRPWPRRPVAHGSRQSSSSKHSSQTPPFWATGGLPSDQTRHGASAWRRTRTCADVKARRVASRKAWGLARRGRSGTRARLPARDREG